MMQLQIELPPEGAGDWVVVGAGDVVPELAVDDDTAASAFTTAVEYDVNCHAVTALASAISLSRCALTIISRSGGDVWVRDDVHDVELLVCGRGRAAQIRDEYGQDGQE